MTYRLGNGPETLDTVLARRYPGEVFTAHRRLELVDGKII
jgi:hypothetical protein